VTARSADPAQAAPLPAVPTTGRSRLLRGTVLGLASMMLACGAHLWAGGHLPDVAVLAILGAIVGSTAVVLTGRRCNFAVLLAALAVEQPLLHYALTETTRCVDAPAFAGSHAGARALVCHPAAGLTADVAASGPAPHAPMLAAHIIATLLTAWMLASGEALLWRLADRVIGAANRTAGPWPQSRRCPTSSRPSWLVLPSLGDDRSPRGPPVRTAAVA
jgi:hypothetical protein